MWEELVPVKAYQKNKPSFTSFFDLKLSSLTPKGGENGTKTCCLDLRKDFNKKINEVFYITLYLLQAKNKSRHQIFITKLGQICFEFSVDYTNSLQQVISK